MESDAKRRTTMSATNGKHTLNSQPSTAPRSRPPVALRCLLGLLVTLATFPTFAADKNGVSPNSISLPKGPGSIEGLGDSFQPTLNTGTAKYGLGIKLPPGTAGHQPSLGLSYDGGGGNGPLGYGWSLSVPHIQRQSDEGIPTYGQFLRSEERRVGKECQFQWSSDH